MKTFRIFVERKINKSNRSKKNCVFVQIGDKKIPIFCYKAKEQGHILKLPKKNYLSIFPENALEKIKKIFKKIIEGQPVDVSQKENKFICIYEMEFEE